MTAITPADHRHGTRAGYLAGCRCHPCATAHNRYTKAYKANREERGTPIRVDATQARQRVLELNTTMSLSAISVAAGLKEDVIFDLAKGARTTIYPRTHNAIMRVTGPPTTGNHHISPTGTTRRLQALQTLGWSFATISEHTGITPEYLADLAKKPPTRVETRIARTITAVYDQLSMTTPIARNPQHGGSIDRIRRLAREHGWLPPLAWDNPDTDTTPPIPDRLNRNDDELERLADLEAMAASGEHIDRAAARLGVTTNSLLTWLRKRDRIDLALQMGHVPARTNFLSD